jgi:hypothetical protein
MTQAAVCSQTDTRHINTVWKEHTVVKIFNLFVHPVTSRFYKVKKDIDHLCKLVGISNKRENVYSNAKHF